jgi:hypothetical protein
MVGRGHLCKYCTYLSRSATLKVKFPETSIPMHLCCSDTLTKTTSMRCNAARRLKSSPPIPRYTHIILHTWIQNPGQCLPPYIYVCLYSILCPRGPVDYYSVGAIRSTVQRTQSIRYGSERRWRCGRSSQSLPQPGLCHI